MTTVLLFTLVRGQPWQRGQKVLETAVQWKGHELRCEMGTRTERGHTPGAARPPSAAAQVWELTLSFVLFIKYEFN